MRTPKEFSTLDYQLARFRKLSGFLGWPKLHGPPLLINSLPKSGTNLIEAFFLGLDTSGHCIAVLWEIR